MIKNILIGKFGKSIAFNKKRWTLSGGYEGIYNLIRLLSNHNPNINFWICSQSDFNLLSDLERGELFPNNNVFQLPLKGLGYEGPLEYILDNKIKIDCGLFMCGLSTNTCIPNKIWKVDGSGYAKTLNWAHRYGAPIVHTLNILQIPYITLSEDPRNIKLKYKDLYNRERKCLSLQKDSYYIRKHIKDYENQSIILENKVPIEYRNIELLCLYGKVVENYIPKYRDILISVFMNKFGLNATTNRKKFIEDYVLSNYPQTKIYGLWEEEIKEGLENFENKKMSNIRDILFRTKYTVVKSLKENFISGKPWEMINYGIIPFISPDYDGDRLLPLPEFLYLENPNSLVEKINYLEENPEEYKSLYNKLQGLLKPEYFSGEFLNNRLMKELDEIYNSI